MEKISTGIQCIKYLLFTFNFIFWLAGTAVLAVALWLRFDSKTTAIFGAGQCPAHFCVGIYILMGVGAVIMIIGFFGCCGAVQESQCLLGSFFACLLVIFAAEITAGVWGFLNKEQIIDTMKSYYKAESEKVKKESKSNITIVTIHKVVSTPLSPSPDSRAFSGWFGTGGEVALGWG
uniref:CD9 antigen-like n=1 Tax=Callorhinchus milii TaxID=7868 RepID=A0A4W3GCM8_CALMI